jgi:hypothetical protein
LSDKNLDKSKVEAFQKMLQSDPKAQEKMVSQVTPEQLSAAFNLLGSLNPDTKKALGGLISGLSTGNDQKTKQ